MRNKIRFITGTVTNSSGEANVNPVQWAVSDRGNGHCYESFDGYLYWLEANVLATTSGECLATITSAEEYASVLNNVVVVNLDPANGGQFWIGGLEALMTDPYSDLDLAYFQSVIEEYFQWITGEASNCGTPFYTDPRVVPPFENPIINPDGDGDPMPNSLWNADDYLHHGRNDTDSDHEDCYIVEIVLEPSIVSLLLASRSNIVSIRRIGIR